MICEALDPMLKRFNEGYDLVVGSRYMPGGEQIGGPWLKGSYRESRAGH